MGEGKDDLDEVVEGDVLRIRRLYILGLDAHAREVLDGGGSDFHFFCRSCVGRAAVGSHCRCDVRRVACDAPRVVDHEYLILVCYELGQPEIATVLQVLLRLE